MHVQSPLCHDTQDLSDVRRKGHIANKTGHAVGKLHLQCRPLLELIPKERYGGLAVFSQALRLVPYIMPDHWTGPRICEELPGSHSLQCCCCPGLQIMPLCMKKTLHTDQSGTHNLEVWSHAVVVLHSSSVSPHLAQGCGQS